MLQKADIKGGVWIDSKGVRIQRGNKIHVFDLSIRFDVTDNYYSICASGVDIAKFNSQQKAIQAYNKPHRLVEDAIKSRSLTLARGRVA